MNHKTILLMLAFVFANATSRGQSVAYTYNAQGSCVSRVYNEKPKDKYVTKPLIDKNLIEVDFSTSQVSLDKLTIAVSGLESEHSLPYTMANVTGQTVLNGSVENGSTDVNISDLPKGTYVIKVSGEDFEESYKLLKK